MAFSQSFGLTAPSVGVESGGSSAVQIADIISRTILGGFALAKTPSSAFAGGFQAQPQFVQVPAPAPASSLFSADNLPVLILVGVGLVLLLRAT